MGIRQHVRNHFRKKYNICAREMLTNLDATVFSSNCVGGVIWLTLDGKGTKDSIIWLPATTVNLGVHFRFLHISIVVKKQKTAKEIRESNNIIPCWLVGETYSNKSFPLLFTTVNFWLSELKMLFPQKEYTFPPRDTWNLFIASILATLSSSSLSRKLPM